MFWEGATYPLAPGLTLIHCGGHFAGSTVLHWAAGAENREVLCTGDMLHVVEDHRYVSFMYSYVNYIPLSGAGVRRITERLIPFSYDRIYGCFESWVVASDAQVTSSTLSGSVSARYRGRTSTCIWVLQRLS